MVTEPELKSAERIAFEHYLRTGRLLSATPTSVDSERKFNPWHDPENGQFTDGLHGSASLGGTRNAPTQRAIVAPAPKPSTPRPTPPKHTAPSEPARPSGWRHGGDLKPAEVEARADHAMAQYDENRRRGMPPDEAAAWPRTARSKAAAITAATRAGEAPAVDSFSGDQQTPAIMIAGSTFAM